MKMYKALLLQVWCFKKINLSWLKKALKIIIEFIFKKCKIIPNLTD